MTHAFCSALCHPVALLWFYASCNAMTSWEHSLKCFEFHDFIFCFDSATLKKEAILSVWRHCLSIMDGKTQTTNADRCKRYREKNTEEYKIKERLSGQIQIKKDFCNSKNTKQVKTDWQNKNKQILSNKNNKFFVRKKAIRKLFVFFRSKSLLKKIWTCPYSLIYYTSSVLKCIFWGSKYFL